MFWIIVLALGCGADHHDLVIRGGLVYDGSGAPPREGDVAVDGDRVVAVGELGRVTATVEVEAAGMAVAPGFINLLSWATDSMLIDGRALSDLRQGVTLEVFGEGISMGPVNERVRAYLMESVPEELEVPVTWTTLGGYLELLEERGVAVNVASMVGATTVRIHEIGFEARKATAAELAGMQRLVRQAMAEGALGVGSALIYTPGSYADTEELVALAAEAAAAGGVYASHLRSEGDRLLPAVDELLLICRRSGARGEIYHLKAAGRDNWAKLEEAIALVEDARSAGLEIGADIYTSTAGATGLDAAMPPWVQEGGHEAWRDRLRDPEIRPRVAAEMLAKGADWENLYFGAGPDKTILIGFRDPRLRPLTGRTLASVAAERGTTPEETAMDLVVEDGSRVEVAYELMAEDNLRRKITLPWVGLCSDEAAPAPKEPFLQFNPHPRAYASFARFLGRYVRDERLIPLEQAIHRLTGMPARHLRLRDRGLIREGFLADLVVFDPAAIADHATFAEPHRLATGVEWVVVNGTVVLQGGEFTGAYPGRVVRGPGWAGWTDGTVAEGPG